MRLCASAVSALARLAVMPFQAAADDGPAKPRVDCSIAKNKTKPECKDRHSAADDEIINGAYWLAHTGKFKESLALLATVANKENPRALNAMGFATRKLGDVEGALPFYTRALAIQPDYVQAREYMGEAFLAKGDLARAREQLGEIAQRVGTGSISFANLNREIAAFEAKRAVPS